MKYLSGYNITMGFAVMLIVMVLLILAGVGRA